MCSSLLLVGHQRMIDMCVQAQSSAIRVFLIIFPCCPCPSSLARASLSSGLIPARCLTKSQLTPMFWSSVEQDGNSHCGVDSTCFKDWYHQLQSSPLQVPLHHLVGLTSTVRLLLPPARRDHRVCDDTNRSLFQHGLCRVLKLGFSLSCNAQCGH